MIRLPAVAPARPGNGVACAGDDGARASDAGTTAKPRTSRLWRDRRGAAAAEFAMIVPVMATVLFSIIKFGVAMNNNVTLTDGVRASVRQFAIGRSSNTAYTDAVARFSNSTPGLNQALATLTFSVNGATCSTDADCKAKLAGATTGQAATLAASYPCNLVIMGFDAVPGCTLSSTTSERVE